MKGFVNSPDAVKGLEFYKELYNCCTPPGPHQRLHVGRARRLQIRPGRHADELVRLLPGLSKDPNVGGDKIGFFANPAGPKAISPNSAARGSRWSPIPTRRMTRCKYIKWFAQPEVQQKWWELGGFRAKAVLRSGLPKSAPFAPASSNRWASSRISGRSRTMPAPPGHAKAGA